MDTSMASSPLMTSSSPSAEAALSLDFHSLPPVFVSRTHFQDNELHDIEDALDQTGATLTYDIEEAGIILSKVTKKTRILFDLRAKGLLTREVDARSLDLSAKVNQLEHIVPSDMSSDEKRPIVIDDSSTASEADNGGEKTNRVAKSKRSFSKSGNGRKPESPSQLSSSIVRVVRVDWIEDSRFAGRVLPLDAYTVYVGQRLPKHEESMSGSESRAKRIKLSPESSPTSSKRRMPPPPPTSILERAKDDAPQAFHSNRSYGRRLGYAASSAATYTKNTSWSAGHTAHTYAQLLHTTTSEEEQGSSGELPEPPHWVKAGIKYACQRSTPPDNPNEAFIELLKKIKLARVLTLDEIGVRAYSTGIAAIVAYPYKLINPREILRLPGCDAKLANLFVEWVNTGKLQAVEEIESDADLSVLRLFYEIWGVGSTTAREFYYDHGWRDLDDLVEYNWRGLSRVQQIGVKYYEEFLEGIPRAEVESIGQIVHRHAVKVRDSDVQSIIVGGYRRGKARSGDVDIIVSHPDEAQTLNIVTDIVASLEDEGWITHTLLLSLNSTRRDQQTLPFRSGTNHGGHGFDSLDKALVVWQDPSWPEKEVDLATNASAKNPNIHRRVDIIVSPWRTVGCAVTGWSGGTTFQRDLRRYAKSRHAWKFDSSGVRDRANGEVLDLEGFHRYDGSIGTGRAKTMVEAEQRVFEGLGLIFRQPHERCTG